MAIFTTSSVGGGSAAGFFCWESRTITGSASSVEAPAKISSALTSPNPARRRTARL